MKNVFRRISLLPHFYMTVNVERTRAYRNWSQQIFQKTYNISQVSCPYHFQKALRLFWLDIFSIIPNYSSIIIFCDNHLPRTWRYFIALPSCLFIVKSSLSKISRILRMFPWYEIFFHAIFEKKITWHTKCTWKTFLNCRDIVLFSRSLTFSVQNRDYYEVEGSRFLSSRKLKIYIRHAYNNNWPCTNSTENISWYLHGKNIPSKLVELVVKCNWKCRVL